MVAVPELTLIPDKVARSVQRSRKIQRAIMIQVVAEVKDLTICLPRRSEGALADLRVAYC